MLADGFQQVVFAHSLGFPYRWPEVRGVLWHTTEGWRAEDAFSVFASFPSCPHFTAEWERGTERDVTQRLFQHVDTSLAAYAVQHGDADHPCAVDTNASGIVQIELVGFAAESGSWPVERLKWIGEKVLAPILAAHPTIPPWVYPLASQRMTEDEWEAWPGGQCRHSDVCCQPQQHGDPGGLDLDLVLHYALEHNRPPIPSPEPEMILLHVTDDPNYPPATGGVLLELSGNGIGWVQSGNVPHIYTAGGVKTVDTTVAEVNDLLLTKAGVGHPPSLANPPSVIHW